MTAASSTVHLVGVVGQDGARRDLEGFQARVGAERGDDSGDPVFHVISSAGGVQPTSSVGLLAENEAVAVRAPGVLRIDPQLLKVQRHQDLGRRQRPAGMAGLDAVQEPDQVLPQAQAQPFQLVLSFLAQTPLFLLVVQIPGTRPPCGARASPRRLLTPSRRACTLGPA